MHDILLGKDEKELDRRLGRIYIHFSVNNNCCEFLLIFIINITLDFYVYEREGNLISKKRQIVCKIWYNYYAY